MFSLFSQDDFLRIPELAINPLGDRIVHAFFQKELVIVLFINVIKMLDDSGVIYKSGHGALWSR